jgi:hypothetical protein
VAWTTPATFTTGNVLTAAQLNTNVRDNTNYLFDQPMALLERTSNLSVANAVGSTVNYDTTVLSSPGITITATSGKFTPTFAGTYQAWANHVWAGSAVGSRESGIVDTSSNNSIAYEIIPGSGSRNGTSISGISGVLNGTTHFLQLNVGQNSGGALNILAASTADTILGFDLPFHFGIKMLGTGS